MKKWLEKNDNEGENGGNMVKKKKTGCHENARKGNEEVKGRSLG